MKNYRTGKTMDSDGSFRTAMLMK